MINLEAIFEEVDNILEEYKDIPFGNSDTQNIYLSVSDAYSDGRKLRTYLLNLTSKKQALEENYYKIEELKIELMKLHRQYENETDELEKKLIEIQIKKKLTGIKYTKKLFYDAVRETLIFLHLIKQLPKITREEFERQELEHFKKKLSFSLTEPAEVQSLKALNITPLKIENNQLILDDKSDEIAKQLEEINKNLQSLSLAGQLEEINKKLQSLNLIEEEVNNVLSEISNNT